MTAPRLSVIVPAHDEAAVIGANLARLVADDRDGRLEVVVVANGCSDDTAAIARAVDPRIRVVEIARAGKPAALDAGDAAASTFPRAYVDADVRIGTAALLALADALDARPGPAVAAPAFTVDAAGSGWLVRQHYRIWELSEYRRSGHIGSGVYAVNAVGRARWGAFPDVIADDRFVQQRFALAERISLDGHRFTVPAPRTMRAQLRRATRIQFGNRSLPDPGVGDRDAAGRYGALVRRVARRPSLWPAFAVYCVGYAVPLLAARLDEARGARPGWNRDESTRTAVRTP